MPTLTMVAHGEDADTASQESSAVTGSYTPTANRVMIATAQTENADNAISFVCSGNGLTWNLFKAPKQPVSGYLTPLFWALSGTSPSAGATTISWSNDPGNAYNVTVYEVLGADPRNPFRQISPETTDLNAATPYCTFGVPTLADSSVLLTCRSFNSATNVVPPAGFTEDLEVTCGDSSRTAELNHHDAPGSVQTLTFGGSVPQWFAYGIEIRADAGQIAVATPVIRR